MELSVESRVKAHISTPYIDADGRGTVGTYSAEVLDCMKPTEEFKASLEGNGAEQVLLRQMENDYEAAMRRFNEFRASVIRRDEERMLKKAHEAEQLTEEIVARRAEARIRDRDAENAIVDQAYRERLISDEHMRRFQDVSRKTLAAKVRDKEEDVRERYMKLKAKASTSRNTQRQVIESHQQRTEEGARRRVDELEAKLTAIRVKIEENQRLRAQEEYDRTVRDRDREARLRKEIQQVRLEAESELAVYEAKHMAAVDNERAANALLVERSRKIHEISTEEGDKNATIAYEKLKDLEERYDEGAAEIHAALLKKDGRGSSLDTLMNAAHDIANKRQTQFPGLMLLSSATLRPSPFTPEKQPVHDGDKYHTRSIQTLISEPIRQPKKRNSRV